MGGRPDARVRPRSDVRRGDAPPRVARQAEPLREDPGDEAGARRDRGLHRARQEHQRHADLLAPALPRGRRGVPARARAARRFRRRPVDGALGRELLRLARRHRSRQAPRGDRHEGGARAARQARDREREARVRALPARVRQRPALGVPRGQGRDAAALPVGVDLDEEPRLPRRDLRRGAHRPRHREHDAGGDDPRLPGSRRGPRRHGDGGRRRVRTSCSRRSRRSASTTTTSPRRSSSRACRSSRTRSRSCSTACARSAESSQPRERDAQS